MDEIETDESEGNTGIIKIPYYDLFEQVRHERLKKSPTELANVLRDFIANKFDIEKLLEGKLDRQLKNDLIKFCKSVSKKWKNCCRKANRFLETNSSWLHQNAIILNIHANTLGMFNKPMGRPTKDFLNCSKKTKKRRVKTIVQENQTDVLCFATEVSLRSSGKRKAALVLSQMSKSNYRTSDAAEPPEKSTTIKAQFTPEEAIALIIDLNLSRHQYMSLRERCLEKGVDVYPSYFSLKKVKADIYPSKEHIRVSEHCAEVNLQNLLDKTAERLVGMQEEVFEQNLDQFESNSLELISKWGFDGSSGQSRYKQKFQDPNSENVSDADLFVTSLVPIQLSGRKNGGKDKIVVWQNRRTSSPRFCRPIRFQNAKESKDLTLSEKENVEGQIAALRPTTVTVLRAGIEVVVSHKLVLTMIDGKVCGALTDTSSQRCTICGAKPTVMNDLVKVKTLAVDERNLEYGLSTLHAWIRFFENLLHISYKLEIGKWQTRDTVEKRKIKERKESIINGFRREMGLLVDMPKQGFGTTNDGNTARRFFKDAASAAQITGLDQRLIARYSVILHALSSGYEIDAGKFKNYCEATANLYVSLYHWYPMPASVHKILIHGADVIEICPLPIGQVSEEAQESRNKDFRRYREFYTRKCSRIKTNEDLLNRLLLSSDPQISSIRSPANLKKGSLSAEVAALLKNSDSSPA